MESLRYTVTKRITTIYVEGGDVLANDVTAADPEEVKAPLCGMTVIS